MLQWLSPAWLAATTAVALPIALHLLSRGERRRVQVGSVRLFAATASRRVRRPRITEWLLLLLRCALLIALAGALAEPRWWSVPEESDEPWILVERTLVDQELLGRKDLPAGTLRVLEAGNIWSQIAAADLDAPPGTPFEIFVIDRQRDFEGRRPTLHHPFTWTAIKPASEAPPEDSTPPPDAPRRVGVRVAAHDSRLEDARFIEAGLQVAAESITAEGAGIEIDREGKDWLVHLSPEPLNDVDCASARLVLSDGLARSAASDAAPIALPALGGIEMRRIFEVEPVDAVALWRTGTGAPLLSAARCGDAEWLRWHGRFHPSSSSFVLESAFPAWLQGLLMELAPAPEAPDPRSIGPQGAPRQGAPSGQARPHAWPEHFLWGLVVVLLIAERRAASRETP